jgi:ubiquinone/menaquinone biosynthesis C-methylase UbiE
MKTAQGLAVDKATERIRRTYDRASLWYDLQEWLPERIAFRRWRRQLWTLVPDGRVLEVGVGTGRNIPCYHDGLEVTAIDFSPRMLRRAETRAKRDGINVSLALMDAQALDFQDSTFDSVVSTFVFCSVPDPIIGLQEIRRVLKPGGRVYLLEHVLSRARVLRWFMQRINGVWRAMSGANINRDTVANVEQAGLRVVEVRDLAADVVKLILAKKAD